MNTHRLHRRVSDVRRRLESQGAYLTPDTPDEVWERGEDGKLHLLDIDALLDKGDSGLLEDDA